MATWVKVTERGGKPLFLNLDTPIAMHVDRWSDSGGKDCTIVQWAGWDDSWCVEETPEEILSAERFEAIDPPQAEDVPRIA